MHFRGESLGFPPLTIQIQGLVVSKRVVPVSGCHAYRFAETLYYIDLIGAKEHREFFY